MTKKTTPATSSLTWDLSIFYDSPDDPQIEADIRHVESAVAAFSEKYDTPDKAYLSDAALLATALDEFERLYAIIIPKPYYYFHYAQSIDSADPAISAKMSLLSQRVAVLTNEIQSFILALGTIPMETQERFLADSRLTKHRFTLKCAFEDAAHKLSLAEERILALKRLPSRQFWITQVEKLLGERTVVWQGRNLPLSEALNLIAEQDTAATRRELALLAYEQLRSVSGFAEGEINAVFIDKKIDDDLRGFKTPYQSTVEEYRNDPAVVDSLIKVVEDHFRVAHRFHAIKAKLLKQDKLGYWDRAAKIGRTTSTYSFHESFGILRNTFGAINPKYAGILDAMVAEGRVDAPPRQGKDSGAFCSGSYGYPTMVLLNHVDTLRSFTTFAHEMGHAFHTEMSKAQGPIYSEYSYSLAETASTLFEAIAADAIIDTLPEDEQIIILHDRVNDSVSTVFRQIACFGFELELHQAVRDKGFVSKEEICAIHNKHMQAYLGPVFELIPDDGLMFVQWNHIRRFFYVYSYAYGMLVSRALLRRYRQDPSFWNKIEQFLSAGGKDTPENILMEIGIDVSDPAFFAEGIRAIEDDIARLEKLAHRS